MNAFTQTWTDLKFYAFPPFIYYSKVIQEIWQDGAEGILVVTGSQFSKMIAKDVLPPRQDLSTTDPSISHPLHQTLQLRATATPRKLKKLHTTQKWCNLLWASWAPKTQTNYNTYVRKWLHWRRDIRSKYGFLWSGNVIFIQHGLLEKRKVWYNGSCMLWPFSCSGKN